MIRVVSLLRALDAALVRAEVALVTAVLLAMVVLKFADVVMRNTGHGGIPAFATGAQHLVIWAGMLGASLATADRKHISIELFAPVLTPQGRRVVEGMVDVATIFFCGLVSYVAVRWIQWSEIEELRAGAASATIFVVPGIDLAVRRWWSLTIIPVGFALIGFRYFRLALERIFVDEPPPDRAAETERAIAEFERKHSSDERPPAAGAAPQ